MSADVTEGAGETSRPDGPALVGVVREVRLIGDAGGFNRFLVSVGRPGWSLTFRTLEPPPPVGASARVLQSPGTGFVFLEDATGAEIAPERECLDDAGDDASPSEEEAP